MDAHTKLKPPPAPYDRKAYTRGWNTSTYAQSATPLDNADARREPEEWYDGYYDAGAGRQKWHLPYCRAEGTHHNDEGGCGWA